MILRYYTDELRTHLPQDYKNIDSRTLIRLINQFRAVWIKNEYNKGNRITDKIAQTLSGISMNIADQSEVAFINTKSRILKSSTTIPIPVIAGNKELILSVRNTNLLVQNYNFISRETAVYSGNGRYNKEDIFCFLYNKYLYLKLNAPKIALIEFVTIEGIFEDPLDCINFQYKTYIDDLDYEYPMIDTMWGYIKSEILTNALTVIDSKIKDNAQNI